MYRNRNACLQSVCRPILAIRKFDMVDLVGKYAKRQATLRVFQKATKAPYQRMMLP
jgi:hypothetical protein